VVAPAPLPPAPATLTAPDGTLLAGLYAGNVRRDPVAGAARRGRVRRWYYVAAGDPTTMVGAAVVDLGFVAVAFAFAAVGGRTATFDTRRVLGVGAQVAALPDGGAGVRGRSAAITLVGDGGMTVDVPTEAGRLRAEVTTTRPVTPAVCATATPDGGWNVTRKTAGSTVTGSVRLGDGPSAQLGEDAGGWSDWTAGRQDRTTVWRWAAGAGIAADGRRVGVNASTGMNAGTGEDVVWWDGVPHRLTVRGLAPVGDDPERDWQLVGPGTDLRLTPVGVRGAVEQLPLLTSNYVQPFGTWTGTLPDPAGASAGVRLAGVAEDHLAVW
jgi:hypothetical protein